jgi:GntR family transcriptional repressor for pyruvate dehydrogenase complex
MGGFAELAAPRTGLRDTLSTQTLQQLTEWLKQGRFKPGSKLPSQNELIERFGISRTGIREALQMMAVLNLIEIRPGLGCFVKQVSPEYIVNADVLSILLKKEAILQVIETRKIVEAGTAALAAERSTPEDFWFIEDVLSQLERAIGRGESVAHIAPEVHYGIARATHNAVLTKLVRSFIHLMGKAGELIESEAEDAEAFKKYELTSHRELYDVVRAGDARAAREIMVRHITDSEQLIAEAFRKAEGAA